MLEFFSINDTFRYVIVNHVINMKFKKNIFEVHYTVVIFNFFLSSTTVTL